MMSETDSANVNVEQYAGDTVRLTTAITGVLNAPEIVEGEVSGSGKTIAVTPPHREGKTLRLDTATIMAGDSEFRDSRSYTLYSREDFQSTQRANYGPGPQAGANGVTDGADLPEPTHTVAGEDSEDAAGDDDDSDGQGGEDGRDEFGRIREGERVHVTGETADGDTLDARGTVANVTGHETAVELDDGRTVRKAGGVIKGRSEDGAPLYYRRPAMDRVTGGEDAPSGDANPGGEGGQTVMTDGGEDAVTARELMDRFGYVAGEPPNPIHGEVTGEGDRYDHPYIFIGSREAYSGRKDWKQKLDAAGYEYHHPEDGRFADGVDIRKVVVTGRSDVETDGGVDWNRPPTEDSDGVVVEAARAQLGDAHVDDVLELYDSRSLAADDLRSVIMDEPSRAMYERARWELMNSGDDTPEPVAGPPTSGSYSGRTTAPVGISTDGISGLRGT